MIRNEAEYEEAVQRLKDESQPFKRGNHTCSGSDSVVSFAAEGRGSEL
jgi:hypothetical protein